MYHLKSLVLFEKLKFVLLIEVQGTYFSVSLVQNHNSLKQDFSHINKLDLNYIFSLISCVCLANL